MKINITIDLKEDNDFQISNSLFERMINQDSIRLSDIAINRDLQIEGIGIEENIENIEGVKIYQGIKKVDINLFE